MTLLPQDLFYFLALSVEQITAPQAVEMAKSSWQHLLAEARTRFIYDELIVGNGIEESRDGYVLEVDHGVSKLEGSLLHRGLATRTVAPINMIGILQQHHEYSLGVSHNSLEHLDGLQCVDFVVTAMARASRHGMIHQVHAIDDPAFEWDRSHQTRLSGEQWEAFFVQWAQQHQDEGWTYAGNHRGASGRPKNHILERNGSIPFYVDYDKQIMRKIVGELSLANGISLGRIPLLLASFDIAKDNPLLLSGLIGAVHALDTVDGYVSRKGLGNSPLGPHIDIAVDHFAELYIAYQYAYEMGFISKSIPWIFSVRNASVDFLRLYNAVSKSSHGATHPHEAFGTTGQSGRKARALYGAIKGLGDMIIPIFPKAGKSISAIHAVASLYRALPVWNSPRAREISKELFEKMKSV